MVFYIRTRKGWEQILADIGVPHSPIWVENDVLTEPELEKLRQAGTNITNFTIKPSKEPDISTIQMHHPDEVILVEA